MHFSSFWEHPFLSLHPEGTRGPKSYAPKLPTTITSVSTPELTAEWVVFFPWSIANGSITDSRQTEEQELWTRKISHKTGTQNSAAVTTVKTQFINSSPHAKYPCQTNTFTNRKGINICQVLQKGLSCWQKNWCLLIGGSFPTPFVIFLAGSLSNENWGLT